MGAIKDLKLGKVTLNRSIVKYLTKNQVDGVRFLYKNFSKEKGSILCGPRRHLFNEWIIFSFIFALSNTKTNGKGSDKNRTSKRCFIITKTEGKKLVWIRFFQNFLPNVLCNLTTKDSCDFLVNCVTFRELSDITSKFSGNEKAFLVVFDEANDLDRELDSKIVKNVALKVPVVFACDSVTPVLDDLQYFHKFLTYCGQELCYTDPFKFINEFCSRQNRGKLRDLIRECYLEYFWNEIKQDHIPYETRELNEALFDEKNSDTIESQDTFECDTVKFVPVIETKSKIPEDLTCNMSPLQLESKSPTSQSIYDADTQPYPAPQSVYGQEMNSGSTYDPPLVAEEAPANITEDLFNDSMELEEVKSIKEVIVISSGSTIGQQTKNRCSSPDDLFSDDEEPEDQPLSKPAPTVLDSPLPLSLPVIKALERCNTKISTPIAQLVNGKAFQDSESPIGFLSQNFWSETKQAQVSKPPDESYFEITKNDVFCNVLRVNENNEISPVAPNKEPERPRPKFDWSAFTGTSTAPESPKTSTSALTSPDKTSEHSSQLLRTPTSKRSTTTPCSSRSSSKKVFKSGGGWLNKYSPVVAPKTPKTPKNRRKKLETLFNDIAKMPSYGNDAQDLLMSPNDLFE